MSLLTPSSENQRDDRRIILIGLLLVMALGTFLRFYQIESESLWSDESIIATLITEGPDEMWDNFIHGRPPVMVYLAYFWAQIFGMSDLAMRSLSAVAGVLSLPLLFLVGSRLFNQRVGLISALLMSIAFFHIYHSQEYRYYSLVVLFVLAAAYFYARALETKHWRDYLLFAVFNIIAVNTHLFAVFVVAAWGLHYLTQFFRQTQKDGRVWWIVSQVVTLIGILPIFYFNYAFLILDSPEPRNPAAWTPEPKFWYPFQTIFRFMFGEGTFTNWQSRIPIVMLFVALVVAFAVWKRNMWWGAVKALPGQTISLLNGKSSQITLLLLWAIMPVALVFVVSLVESIYVDRYLIGAAPGLYLLIAVAVVHFERIVPVALSIGLIIFFAVLPLSDYYSELEKPQWRDAANYLKEHATEADAVHVPIYSEPFYWYYTYDTPQCSIDRTYDNPNAINIPNWDPAGEIARFEDCQTVWVVLHDIHPGNAEGQAKKAAFLELMTEAGYNEVDQQYFHRTFVYEFSREEAVASDN